MKKTYRSFFCLLAVLLLSVSALPAASALFRSGSTTMVR